MSFSVIIAASLNGGVGWKNSLPWGSSPADMGRFRTISLNASQGKQNAVIMGKNTYMSILSHNQRACGRIALPNRINIVVSTSLCKQKETTWSEDLIFVASLSEALQHVSQRLDCDQTFVIGGIRLFNEAFSSNLCRRVYWTSVLSDSYECDTFIDQTVLTPENGWDIVPPIRAITDGRACNKEGALVPLALEFILYERVSMSMPTPTPLAVPSSVADV